MNIMPSPSNIGSMKTKLYGNCIKLEGLQVESSKFNYKVVKPLGGISKSVSPDSTVSDHFLANYTKFVLRA
jgi:hypothetical protein